MASPAPQPRTSFGEAAYHEFSRDDFEPRAHYRPLWEHIRRAGHSLLSERRREAHGTLRTDGVTFTVYGDEADAIERQRLPAPDPAGAHRVRLRRPSGAARAR